MVQNKCCLSDVLIKSSEEGELKTIINQDDIM